MKRSKAIPYVSVLPSGYGHWKVTIEYRGKKISAITDNSRAVDDYNSDEDEKVGRVLRKKRGYETLRSEVIRKNYPK